MRIQQVQLRKLYVVGFLLSGILISGNGFGASMFSCGKAMCGSLEDVEDHDMNPAPKQYDLESDAIGNLRSNIAVFFAVKSGAISTKVKERFRNERTLELRLTEAQRIAVEKKKSAIYLFLQMIEIMEAKTPGKQLRANVAMNLMDYQDLLTTYKADLKPVDGLGEDDVEEDIPASLLQLQKLDESFQHNMDTARKVHQTLMDSITGLFSSLSFDFNQYGNHKQQHQGGDTRAISKRLSEMARAIARKPFAPLPLIDQLGDANVQRLLEAIDPEGTFVLAAAGPLALPPLPERDQPVVAPDLRPKDQPLQAPGPFQGQPMDAGGSAAADQPHAAAAAAALLDDGMEKPQLSPRPSPGRRLSVVTKGDGFAAPGAEAEAEHHSTKVVVTPAPSPHNLAVPVTPPTGKVDEARPAGNPSPKHSPGHAIRFRSASATEAAAATDAAAPTDAALPALVRASSEAPDRVVVQPSPLPPPPTAAEEEDPVSHASAGDADEEDNGGHGTARVRDIE